MTAPSMGAELVQAFRYKVTMTVSHAPSASAQGPTELGDGMFAECSGLELEADVREYLEGGRNNGVVRRVGRVKLSPIVLKRGMFVASADGYVDTALWDWLTGMVSGILPIPRYDGMVQVMSPNGAREVARWIFTRALPTKVSGTALNAKTGEIAIEELHLVHEGLRLWNPSQA